MDVDASAKMEYRGDSSVVNIRGRTLDILYGKNTGWTFSRINRWFSGLNVVNEAQNGRLKKVVFFK